MHDRYTETPEYLSLVRGALHFMKVSCIDLLVVGLPVALLSARKSALEKLMVGEHPVGGGKTVFVKKALALAQPQGALIQYATVHEKLDSIQQEQSVIIDPGARTFDWLVARGMRLLRKRSHSVNRGMMDIFQAIALEIGEDIGSTYRDFDAIDLALRTGKSPVIFQRSYDISKFLPIARTIAQQSVSTMMQFIGETHSYQNLVLAGGGDFLFKKLVKDAFPRHRIYELRDPIYANVRGLQIAGQNYVASSE